ncbi:MAG: RNA pseudouridine synthase [Thioalkalispiraceae bacterium]|jgi:tRNA pseudouridine32 synthase/23S rRNA pseudouridine746 synthase
MPEIAARFEVHIDIQQDDVSALELLAGQTTLSRQAIKQVMQKGAVWLTRGKHTQRLRRAKKHLAAGDRLHCYYDQAVLEQTTPDAQLIADEEEYSVWYKPYGMRSQGSKWGDHTTISRYAEQYLQPQRRAYIVHRLDRAASGLILLAHKKKIAAAFAEMFRQHVIDKHYRVVVHGKFPATSRRVESNIDGKQAVSHIALLDYCPQTDRSLLEVKIETGRKHQIRRHLSGLGFPVVGDRLYGQQADNEDLQLVACHLGFKSPVDGSRKDYQLAAELMPHL